MGVGKSWKTRKLEIRKDDRADPTNHQSPTTMKILHIITRLIQGGAQQNTVLSCAAQVSAGHEVHLAYGPIYGPEGSLL